MTISEATETIREISARRRLVHLANGYTRIAEPDTLSAALDVAVRVMKDYIDCRHELCVLCGKAEKRHLGACSGCRWEEGK